MVHAIKLYGTYGEPLWCIQHSSMVQRSPVCTIEVIIHYFG
nr:hypothetical protein [Prevotella sp.]